MAKNKQESCCSVLMHLGMHVDSTKGALGSLLNENSLTFKDLQCLLEACNLCLPALHSLGVGLGLGHASCLDSLVVLVHCIQLRLHTCPVSIGFGCVLVQTLGLFGLVLDILFLGCLGDGILLGGSFILRDCGLLSTVHLCQTLGEVGLADFEEANDARACAISRRVGLVSLGVVVVQHLEGKADTLDSLLHLSAVDIISSLLLSPDLVHLCLGPGQFGELLLQLGDLLLAFGRGGLILVNVGGQLLNGCLLLRLLGLSLAHLLVAECLLSGIGFCLLVQLLNHVADQIFHFGKWVARAAPSAHGDSHALGKLGKGGVLGLGGKVAHEANSLKIGKVSARGHLQEAVGLLSSTRSCLRNDLLGSGKCLQLFTR